MTCFGLGACVDELTPDEASRAAATSEDQDFEDLDVPPGVQQHSATKFELETGAPLELTKDGDAGAVWTLVYAQESQFDAEGFLVAGAEVGEAPSEFVRERVARQYRHMHEDTLYADEGWVRTDQDGVRQQGYRVWSAPNPNPELVVETWGPPDTDPRVAELLASDWDEDEMHSVFLVTRNLPEWDIPLALDPALASDEPLAEVEAARKLAIADRSAKFKQLNVGVQALLEDYGVKPAQEARLSGWQVVRVSKPLLEALAVRNDLAQISIADSEPESAEQGAGWNNGEGGTDARMDYADYPDRGYTGAGDWPTPMFIGVIENTAVRDTACGFRDGPGCTGASRFTWLWDCETAGAGAMEGTGSGICLDPDLGNICCIVGSPYPTATANSQIADESGVVGNFNYAYMHGNSVSSVVAADYTEGQANGKAVGDPGWTGSTCTLPSDCTSGTCEAGLCAHTSGWEQAATGVAPDAQIIYFGRAQYAPAKAHAMYTANFSQADVISFAQGLGIDTYCHPRANLAGEIEAENLFDNGKLVVACAGNTGAPGFCDTNACSTWAPAALAKTLAVTRFNSDDANCSASYNSCAPDSNQCPGGATLKVNGTSFTAAASLTDLVAASNILSMTVNNTSMPAEGRVAVSDAAFGGCSAATPRVAAAAALVKEYFVDIGASWISMPGRLHTIMLLMADRGFDADGVPPFGFLNTGGDWRWGFGRSKLRFYGATSESAPVGLARANSTFPAGSTNTQIWRPFGASPLPGGVVQVKCAMLQFEDFSGASEPSPVSVSNLDLTVRITNPSGGSCPATPPTPPSDVFSRADTSKDWKSMVSVRSLEVGGGLAGKCVYASRTSLFTDIGGITYETACQYTGALDSAG